MTDKCKPVSINAMSTSLKALTEEAVGALHLDDNVQTAGMRMRDHDSRKWPVKQDRGLSYLPVVDREMHTVGIFSREEIQAPSQVAAPAA